MAKAKSELFLVFLCLASFAASVSQAAQCDYSIVINTGRLSGPEFKVDVIISIPNGKNINTTNIEKKWGASGAGHTYFLANANDRFKTQGPCFRKSFCNIQIKGRPSDWMGHPWHINSIIVTTKGPGIYRTKTFSFRSKNEFFTPVNVNEGRCH